MKGTVSARLCAERGEKSQRVTSRGRKRPEQPKNAQHRNERKKEPLLSRKSPRNTRGGESEAERPL